MSNLSSALKNTIPFVDPDTGKTYSVSLAIQSKKIDFTDWLEARARNILRERFAAEKITRAEYQAALSSLEDDIIAGKYEFDSVLVQKSLGTVLGSTRWASLLFGISEAEITDLANRHFDLVKSVLEQAIAASAPRSQAKNDEGPAGQPETEQPESTNGTALPQMTSMPSSPAC